TSVSKLFSRTLNIAAQAQELVKRLIDGSLRIFLLKWLLPFFSRLFYACDGLIGGKAGLLAVHEANPGRFELREAGTNCDKVGVHQFNQGSPQQKIEADKCQKRRRVVKHSSRRLLYLTALFDEIGFQDVSQAAEAAERLDHLFERFAPCEW